jgi:hypothetical protein
VSASIKRKSQVEGIATEALDVMEGTNQQVLWMGSLMKAITVSLDHQEADIAAGLASLGAHLAGEWTHYLEDQTVMFRRCLAEQEAGQ